MRSNIQNTTYSNSLREIDSSLENIEKTLIEIVKNSIDEITKDPAKEKEMIALWTNHANKISNFFFEECERTGNKGLYKNIVKYAIFNR